MMRDEAKADYDKAQAELQLIKDTCRWMQVMLEAGHKKPWPSDADIQKSRLFARIRAGIDPLCFPPPVSHGKPWYDVIEGAGPWSVWVGGCINLAGVATGDAACAGLPRIVINQTPWVVRETVREDQEYIVSHGHWPLRYRLLRGPAPDLSDLLPDTDPEDLAEARDMRQTWQLTRLDQMGTWVYTGLLETERYRHLSLADAIVIERDAAGMPWIWSQGHQVMVRCEQDAASGMVRVLLVSSESSEPEEIRQRILDIGDVLDWFGRRDRPRGRLVAADFDADGTLLQVLNVRRRAAPDALFVSEAQS